MPEIPCHAAPLSNLASISIGGADARSFLTAQLSQLPPGPDASYAVLAAWHDAKGRVQAVFRVLRHDGGYLLLTHTSVVGDVAAALQRYVLRAGVEIAVAAAHDAALAVVGDCEAWLAARGVELPAEAGAIAIDADIHWLRIGSTLVYAVATSETLAQLAAELPSTSVDEAELSEIRLGLPVVSAALRGLFLPQMLNLDQLGAVAFDKGCYPGQEIIARTQNLGAVKRRLRRFTAASKGLPEPGSRVLDAAGREVGTVVRAAPVDGNLELLAVVELGAIDGPLQVDSDTATTLRVAGGVAPRSAR